MTSKAFCPGNVSCIFRIVEHKKPKKMHSLGVGFTVDKGVTVSVERNNMNNYFLNGKGIKAIPTVESVIGKLTDEQFKIEIKTELPFGCGFGLSGACALATAYAINKELNLKHEYSNCYFGLQVADVIANSIFKKFEHNDDKLYLLIKNNLKLKKYYFE